MKKSGLMTAVAFALGLTGTSAAALTLSVKKAEYVPLTASHVQHMKNIDPVPDALGIGVIPLEKRAGWHVSEAARVGVALIATTGNIDFSMSFQGTERLYSNSPLGKFVSFKKPPGFFYNMLFETPKGSRAIAGPLFSGEGDTWQVEHLPLGQSTNMGGEYYPHVFGVFTDAKHGALFALTATPQVPLPASGLTLLAALVCSVLARRKKQT